MMLLCQQQQMTFLLSCFFLCGTNLFTNGELSDLSENELDNVKSLSKRDTGMLSDTVDSNKINELEDLDTRFNELLYGDSVDKRVLESTENLDLKNFDHKDPPFYFWEEANDANEDDLHLDDKRGVDRYSFIGALGKRPVDYEWLIKSRASDDTDKRTPFGFHGQLGKRAPFGFRGQLGKRAPFGFRGQLGKRAPFGFRGQLGKRAPFGFRGQLGKRAPYGFIGQLGKRAPFGFMGQLGKRAPMAFIRQLGKQYPIRLENNYVPDNLQRRSPMGFIGQLGKRQDTSDSFEQYEDSDLQKYNEDIQDQYGGYLFNDESLNEDEQDQQSKQQKRSEYELPYWYFRDQYTSPTRLVRGIDKLSFSSRLGKRREDINYRFLPQLG